MGKLISAEEAFELIGDEFKYIARDSCGIYISSHEVEIDLGYVSDGVKCHLNVDIKEGEVVKRKKKENWIEPPVINTSELKKCRYDNGSFWSFR